MVLGNGITVNITNNAFLVIDNSNPNAITRNTSGHIISEGQYNRVKWNVGTNAGSYVVPFGIGASSYLPVSLTASGAAGAGSLIFAMYPVGSWLNSSNLPAGVTNFVNNYGSDNSMNAIDRFWRIEPSGYTTKPAFTDLILTYLDIEHTAASNSIIEANLIGQRYNDVSNSWDDYMPGTVISTSTNTATIASLPSTELYTWWTLVDNRFILPIALTAFNGVCEGDKVRLNWQTASEKNNDHFIVERADDAVHFTAVQQINSQDPNSTRPLNYSIYDDQPLKGKTYYRLKQVDKDGNFSYSSIVVVNCKTGNITPAISLYPNPAENEITMEMNGMNGKLNLVLYTIHGQQLLERTVNASPNENILEPLDISALAPAIYIIRIDVNDEFLQALKFVKK